MDRYDLDDTGAGFVGESACPTAGCQIHSGRRFVGIPAIAILNDCDL